MTKARQQVLHDMVTTGTSLSEMIEELRRWKEAGVSQQEAEQTLTEIRAEIEDEENEDRVLELMDFVTGFCSAENSIWQ